MGFSAYFSAVFLLLVLACQPSINSNSPDEKHQTRNVPANNLKGLEPILKKTHQFSQEEEIDLHGQKLHAAASLISEFLNQAKALGKKHVLIITGKGLHSKETVQLSDGSEAGKIKAAFLDLLQNKFFDSIIKAASYAHPVHGGEGAFYVELRY